MTLDEAIKLFNKHFIKVNALPQDHFRNFTWGLKFIEDTVTKHGLEHETCLEISGWENDQFLCGDISMLEVMTETDIKDLCQHNWGLVEDESFSPCFGFYL